MKISAEQLYNKENVRYILLSGLSSEEIHKMYKTQEGGLPNKYEFDITVKIDDQEINFIDFAERLYSRLDNAVAFCAKDLLRERSLELVGLMQEIASNLDTICQETQWNGRFYNQLIYGEKSKDL